MECSAGTYVRSLAHDLGQTLGCGAHLAGLRRTASGDYLLSDCHSPGEVEAWARAGRWEKFLIPLEGLLPGIPAVILTAEGKERTRHGNRIMPGHIQEPLRKGATPCREAGPVFRLFSEDGKLLALAEYSPEENALLPSVVFME